MIFNGIHKCREALIMSVSQLVTAGLNILYKMAANDGMSMDVLVAYRFLFAASFMAPLAFFVERNSRPKLTRKVAILAFLCGLGASMAQNLYAKSLELTTATFASAMSNLVPALTFVMAIFFRMETFGFGTKAGIAKVLGTIVSIVGAMLLTLYKGVEINLWSIHTDLLTSAKNHAKSHHDSANNENVLGPLLAIASCFAIALSLIAQTKMSEKYPCHYSSTAMIACMGSAQAVVYALCMERDWRQWKLGWNIRLLTVTYAGILASGIMVVFVMWCIRIRGPVFVSAFGPLMPVLTAIAGCFLLDEKLHFGSMIGALLIICGLYMVLWGKGKDVKKNIVQLVPSKSSESSKSLEIVIALVQSEKTKPSETRAGDNIPNAHFSMNSDLSKEETRIQVKKEEEEEDTEQKQGDD